MSHGQLKIFSGSAHPSLAREIAEHLSLPLGAARLHRFPDTEVSFQIDENIRGTDVFVVQPTSAPVDPLKVLPVTTNDMPSLKTPPALSTNALPVIEPLLPAVK